MLPLLVLISADGAQLRSTNNATAKTQTTQAAQIQLGSGLESTNPVKHTLRSSEGGNGSSTQSWRSTQHPKRQMQSFREPWLPYDSNRGNSLVKSTGALNGSRSTHDRPTAFHPSAGIAPTGLCPYVLFDRIVPPDATVDVKATPEKQDECQTSLVGPGWFQIISYNFFGQLSDTGASRQLGMDRASIELPSNGEFDIIGSSYHGRVPTIRVNTLDQPGRVYITIYAQMGGPQFK